MTEMSDECRGNDRLSNEVTVVRASVRICVAWVTKQRLKLILICLCTGFSLGHLYFGCKYILVLKLSELGATIRCASTLVCDNEELEYYLTRT